MRLRAGKPKTPKSQRDLSLRGPVGATVRALRADQNRRRLAAGSDWGDSGYLFTTTNGDAVYPSNMYRRYKELLADKAKLTVGGKDRVVRYIVDAKDTYLGQVTLPELLQAQRARDGADPPVGVLAKPEQITLTDMTSIFLAMKKVEEFLVYLQYIKMDQAKQENLQCLMLQLLEEADQELLKQHLKMRLKLIYLVNKLFFVVD